MSVIKSEHVSVLYLLIRIRRFAKAMRTIQEKGKTKEKRKLIFCLFVVSNRDTGVSYVFLYACVRSYNVGNNDVLTCFFFLTFFSFFLFHFFRRIQQSKHVSYTTRRGKRSNSSWFEDRSRILSNQSTFDGDRNFHESGLRFAQPQSTRIGRFPNVEILSFIRDSHRE